MFKTLSVKWGVPALLAMAVVFSPGCNKDNNKDHESDDSVAPTLVIASPAAGALQQGSIAIVATANDETSLHEMKVTLTRDDTGATLLEADPTVHDLTAYTYTNNLTTVNLSAETNLTLVISVEDHGSNKTEKTVRFTYKP